MIIGVSLIILGVVIAGLGFALSATGSSGSAQAERKAERATAQSLGLSAADVPRGWGQDNPASSPLAGLLGTAPSSKPTPSEKKANDEVVSEYQRCMGISNKNDRMFGAAGTTPLVQVPSAPFGTSDGTSLIEVGTATQRYRSATTVAGDARQARDPNFGVCFAQAMGRFVAAGADPTQAMATPTVVTTSFGHPLGAQVSGAVVSVGIANGTGGFTQVEIGTALIIHDRTEQFLYTFSSPGSFPEAERQQLTALLAGRVAGIGNPRAA